MRKVILSAALFGIFVSANAQCSSVNKGIKALKRNNIEDAKALFKKAEGEFKTSDSLNETIDQKCYARYYYGAGSTVFQGHEENKELDLTSRVALLNKADGLLSKYFELNYEDESMQVKAETVLEAVANRQKEVGYAYFQKSNFETALRMFEKCIESKKKLKNQKADLNAYHNASVAASRIGNFEKALLYNEVLLQNPSLKIGEEENLPVQFLARKGEYLAELKRTDEALSVLDSTAKLFPSNVSVQFTQLGIYMGQDNDDKSIVILENLTKKITNREDLFLIMGQIYRKKNETAKSLSAYKSALAINPKSETALYSIGVHYVNAADDYVKEINKEIKTKEAKANREAAIKKRNDQLNEAIGYFNSCLEINPKDRSTLNALKMIYELQENKEKVEEINQKLKAE